MTLRPWTPRRTLRPWTLRMTPRPRSLLQVSRPSPSRARADRSRDQSPGTCREESNSQSIRNRYVPLVLVGRTLRHVVSFKVFIRHWYVSAASCSVRRASLNDDRTGSWGHVRGRRGSLPVFVLQVRKATPDHLDVDGPFNFAVEGSKVSPVPRRHQSQRDPGDRQGLPVSRRSRAAEPVSGAGRDGEGVGAAVKRTPRRIVRCPFRAEHLVTV